MKIEIIIQARLGSTRLPNKMVMPFYKKSSILNIIIEKLKGRYALVLATTIESQDDVLAELASNLGINVYRGSEDNVLERFIEAGENAEIDVVIRVCADNPFINIELLESLIEKYQDEDYCSFKYENGKPTILGHLGLFCEIVKLEALKKVITLTQDKLYLEHVTNYIYSNPNLFNISLHELPDRLIGYENIRMTVDTKFDFEIVSKLYSKYHNHRSIEELKVMLNDIKSNNVLLSSMKEEIINNSK